MGGKGHGHRDTDGLVASSSNLKATNMNDHSISDLRHYIEVLEARGEVNVVEREVDPQFELAG